MRPSAKRAARRAERLRALPREARELQFQRFAAKVRIELKAMFFSGGNVGVGMPRTITADEAGDKAAEFYRTHESEIDALHRAGFGATAAARTLGDRYGVRYFR